MYTVIFINDHSARFIEDYRFLFRPFELRGDVSFCNWNEAGETAETAVPELAAHLAGKHEWRAVILNTDIAEPEPGVVLPDSQNPFDYSNADADTGPHVTPIPIIRLSQILGGYTAEPRCEFEDGYAIPTARGEVRVSKSALRNIFDDDAESFDIESFLLSSKQLFSGNISNDERDLSETRKQRYIEFCNRYQLDQRWIEDVGVDELRPVYIEKTVSDETIQKYRRLNRQYALNEPRPIEILMVSLRETTPVDERQRIREAWRAPITLKNSSFWEFHHYPTTCRFLCSDIRLDDVSAYERDKSIYCYAVLTLAVNRIPAAALQAYRLYRLSVDIDKDAMKSALNMHLDRLAAIKSVVESRLAAEPESSFGKKESVLQVQHVPVVVETDDARQMFDESDGDKKDTDELSQRVQEKKKLANTYGRDPRRAIDRAAKTLRERAARFGGVYELDNVQRENLIDEISRLEAEILVTRPHNRYDKQKFVETASKVEQDVNLKTSTAMGQSARNKAFVVAAIIVIFGFTPYLYYSMQAEVSTKIGAVLLAIAVVIVTLSGGILAIYWSNAKEKQTIDEVTAPLEGLKHDVAETRSEFDQYFTNICTLMKAHSILDGAEICEDESMISRRQLLTHLRAIQVSESRNMQWLTIYEMARQNTGVHTDAGDFRQDIQPDENDLYYLDTAADGSDIPLNASGDTVMQPYSFIERLYVEHEDVFEKENGSI